MSFGDEGVPTPQELEAARTILSWIGIAKSWALAFVAIGVAVEFVADRAERPYLRKLEEARQLEIDQAKSDNLTLQGTAAILQSEAANARTRQAEAETEVLNLQKRLSWRRITQEQHDRFVPLLKPYAGSFVKISGMGNGDLESETFARDIEKLLQDAHWNVNLDFSNITLPALVGLDCRIDERSAAGKTLAEVLNDLPTAVIFPTPFTGAVAFIKVGLKPPP
jgi:hypothetical protein